jgi:hypothetical protein
MGDPYKQGWDYCLGSFNNSAKNEGEAGAQAGFQGEGEKMSGDVLYAGCLLC